MLWFFLILAVVLWLLPYWFEGYRYRKWAEAVRRMEWELADLEDERARASCDKHSEDATDTPRRRLATSSIRLQEETPHPPPHSS